MHRAILVFWRAYSVPAVLLGCCALAPWSTTSGGGSTESGSSPGVRPAAGPGTSVLQENAIQHPLLFPRTTYAWPYDNGPVYGELSSARWADPGSLHTMVGSFDLPSGPLPFPEELRAVAAEGPSLRHFILQVEPASFADGRFDALRAMVVELGGTFLDPMAVAAFVTRIPAEAQGKLLAQPGVLALEPYHPAFKLSPSIGRAPLADPERAVSLVYRLQAVLFAGEDAKSVAASLSELGAHVTDVRNDVVSFELARARLAAAAGLEPIRAIFEELPILMNAEETTVAVQTGKYGAGATPYHDAGIRGDGNQIAGTSPQILMVLDNGLQLDAGDLSDTRTQAAGTRKVLLYTTAITGIGDALGCDAGTAGGFTHGHVVSATALGNATDVPVSYGSGWLATDWNGASWKLDGVAPRAKLLFYDAQVTPSTGSCSDPRFGLTVGTIYTDNTPGSGSLGDAYALGARVFNFSWGTVGPNTYGVNAMRIDQFLFDSLDAMLFVSAGNQGDDRADDGIPDPGSISDPATCKSCIVIGGSGNLDLPDDVSNQEDRAAFSGVGPVGATGRIAPLLLAPGTDFGADGENMGMDSEYSCKSSDNDQSNPVQCDLAVGRSGTSFSSAAAAGAALLVRDHFAQGFYPDGSSTNLGNAADQVPNVSGALVKAVLVTSADWVGVGGAVGGNESLAYRFNREQGYGRIQLSNALPLSTYGPSPLGMVVSDGGLLSGGRLDLSGLPGMIPTAGTTQIGVLEVNDPMRELRCALAWVEDQGDMVAHDLDLELVSPSSKVYLGNFFTEDVNRNGMLDSGENCHDRGVVNGLDEEIWSIETNGCGLIGGSRNDAVNPTEAIFLSPDPLGNGIADDSSTAPINEAVDNQIETGAWTIKVIYRTGSGTQRYAVSCSGAVASGSTVRLDKTEYTCSDVAHVTVNETIDGSDPTPSVSEVSSRVSVRVYDSLGVQRDIEAGLPFTATSRRYDSSIVVSGETGYDPGNGALDVQHGDRIEVEYRDESGGGGDPAKKRLASAAVHCQPRVGIGGLAWATFGKDVNTLVNGGCERDARNLFTFGFPDRHMDAGELINYRFAFRSMDAEDLRDAVITLRCETAPGVSCTEMSILDSPLTVLLIPAGQVVSANFNLQMAATITGTPKVQMILGISARKSGKPVEAVLVSRHRLDVDEASVFYSTDFPAGGTETRDYNGSETVQVVTTSTGDFDQDYLFETRTYGDLTAGGTKNTGLQSPWSFDANDGGFRVGLNPSSTNLGAAVVANWGEDQNFNNLLDPGDDREPSPFGSAGVLDRSWSTRGGCGWQTRSANPTGGIWHTGGIDLTSLACGSQCELVDTIPGTSGVLRQWEMLVTPVIQKVNTGVDAEGDPTHQVQFTNWAWNMALDLESELDTLVWELDTDASSTARADLFGDEVVLNGISGPQGVLAGGNAPLTDGFPIFAPFSGTTSVNGTVGNNRMGKNACLFENAGTAGRHGPVTWDLAKPEDRSDGIASNGLGDVDDDGDTLVDEFVTASGPIRNFDLRRVNGPDLRFVTLEDVYGDAGNSFQGALGFQVAEGTSALAPTAGYGVGVDDMVLEWREFSLLKDATSCAAGACATVSLAVTHAFEGAGVLAVTVLDATPYDAAFNKNDCNGDGDYNDADDDPDCDDNSIQDVLVKLVSEAEPAGERIFLNRVVLGGAQWTGTIAFSSDVDVPGVLYVARNGAGAPAVKVRYEDRDDGTGTRCASDPDPSRRGLLEASTAVVVDAARILVKSARLANDGAGVGGVGYGDNDGWADTNETVKIYLTLSNRSGVPRSGLVARLSTNDPAVDCILVPTIAFGSIDARQTREEGGSYFVVKFKSTVARTDPNAELTATFNVSITGDDFDTATRPQRLVLDLDLNVAGGLVPASYAEGFEGAGFGSFTTMSLDTGHEGNNAASNGFRCQYSDPDFVNSNAYGNAFCYLGAGSPAGNVFDWHVHGLASPDGGRAYLGNNALHWGRHLGAAGADTTALRQLDAVRTTNPVNLAWNGVTPELSFKHQIGLADCDQVNCPVGYGVDRGVVYVQIADSAGVGVGSWHKIAPYENIYDSQALDHYANCTFDPTDDGNAEDDYFDPTDPNRRLGPSTTCHPEFSFTHLGAIAYNATFHPNAIGHAVDGPGLQGVLGPGTWVQSKFTLDRYRGRRVRVRFLVTSIEGGDAVTMQDLLGWNPTDADDGWYIDDVLVSNTLTSPATVTADTAGNAGLPPSCSGSPCTSIAASLAASPSGTAAPAHPTTLDASGSSGTCINGALQYRFWTTDNNTVVGDAGDVLLRTWTTSPILVDAPLYTTRYGVEVRCSALTSCMNSTTITVPVLCPSTGDLFEDFPATILVSGNVVSWDIPRQVDVIVGDLTQLLGTGSYFSTVTACLANDVTTASVTDTTPPLAASHSKYYLVRGTTAKCNKVSSWVGTSGVLTAARNDQVNASAGVCP